MICAVCGTDRHGMDNGPHHRRILDMPELGRTVIYCADISAMFCGEAKAMEYLEELTEASHE